MADAIPGARSSALTTSAGKSFMSTVVAKMPFAYNLIQNISEMNPKYQVFQDLVSNRETRLAQQSVFATDSINGDGSSGMMAVDRSYHRFMYANLDLDKVKRLQDYRVMARYNILSDCLDEICDELLFEDDDGEYLKLNVAKDAYSDAIIEEIQKEWQSFVKKFEFRENGWEMFRRFLIDGELFWENIIDDEHPEYGILGLVSIPTELINPFYQNVVNGLLQGFAMRRPVVNQSTDRLDKEELVIMEPRQVTYIHSGYWNEDSTIRLPSIDNARRAYKQLSLIEDSVVIHRLVHSPLRLVFHVDTGNMSPPRQESYLKRLMQQVWSKKTFDTSTGRVTNVYDPQSMLDAYFFPRRTGNEGTKVDQLQSGANMGDIPELTYFLKQLYKSMKVPTGRLNAEDAFKDGNDSTREEVRFGKFLKRIQLQFAKGIKKSFITHLQLRKYWSVFNLRSQDFDVSFNVSSSFEAMRHQQFLDLKYNNFNNMSQNEGVSNSFAQKKYLGWGDDDMAANREWKRRDAALQWEIESILANGPNWKSQIQSANAAVASMDGGGMPMGGSGGASPPPFGPAPDGGEPAPAPTEPPAGGAVQSPATATSPAPAPAAPAQK